MFFVMAGEAVEESGAAALSIGLAPLAERKETWCKNDHQHFDDEPKN